jgi:hypothetical protein
MTCFCLVRVDAISGVASAAKAATILQSLRHG